MNRPYYHDIMLYRNEEMLNSRRNACTSLYLTMRLTIHSSLWTKSLQTLQAMSQLAMMDRMVPYWPGPQWTGPVPQVDTRSRRVDTRSRRQLSFTLFFLPFFFYPLILPFNCLILPFFLTCRLKSVSYTFSLPFFR